MKEEFKNTYRIVVLKEAKLNSFFDCINVLEEIFKEEKEINRFKEIFINISTASKAFALAAYIFGLFHPQITKIFYMKTSNYILLDYLEDNNKSISNLMDEFIEYGLTKGPYKIDEIPLLPIFKFSSNEKVFIKTLSKKKNFNSIDNFMAELPEDFKDLNRVKVRRILASLEEKELIRIFKSGRYQVIKVSDLLVNLSKIIL